MNAHAPAPIDPDAFLRWNQHRDGKREFVRGRVVELMINVTRAHSHVVTRLLIELGRLVDPRRFEVHGVDFGMKTPDSVRFPDVVVDLAGGGAKDLSVREPVFVCEVLSPSSLARDLVEKLAEYRGIESLTSYLVLAQDEPRGWLWARIEGAWAEPVSLDGADAVIDLEALAVKIELARLYPASVLR